MLTAKLQKPLSPALMSTGKSSAENILFFFVLKNIIITGVRPAYRAETELIGHRDEVDSDEGEIVGNEDLLGPGSVVVVVVVGGVAEDDHAQTDAESRHHQKRSPGEPAEQESSDESGQKSDHAIDDGGVRLVNV